MLNKVIKDSLLEVLTHMGQTNIDIDTVTLFGTNGIFDSMSLVSFIVILEEKLQDTFNINVLLANEKALSHHNSPFKNFSNLTNYIEKNFLKEAKYE